MKIHVKCPNRHMYNRTLTLIEISLQFKVKNRMRVVVVDSHNSSSPLLELFFKLQEKLARSVWANRKAMCLSSPHSDLSFSDEISASSFLKVILI